MGEAETVAAVWKTIAYVLGTVVVALSGTIAKMAHWIVKEKAIMVERYADLNKALDRQLDRIGDHIRDLTNEVSEGRTSRTQHDFRLNSDSDD